MTHADLKHLFIKYHQEKWPDRRIFSNNTGWAKYGNTHIPYGIPLPKKGRLKKMSGGGADLISFGPENGVLSSWFFEIKTKKDTLKSNQKWFAEWAVKNNARYWIVKEDASCNLGFRFIDVST